MISLIAVQSDGRYFPLRVCHFQAAWPFSGTVRVGVAPDRGATQPVSLTEYWICSGLCRFRRFPLIDQVSLPYGLENFMTDGTKINSRSLQRDAAAMLNAGKDPAALLQSLEVSQSTPDRWRAQYGGMKAEEAKRLKELEKENSRLKRLWRM